MMLCTTLSMPKCSHGWSTTSTTTKHLHRCQARHVSTCVLCLWGSGECSHTGDVGIANHSPVHFIRPSPRSCVVPGDPVRLFVGWWCLYRALGNHPFFLSCAASGQCFLMAAAANVLCGVVLVLAGASSRTGVAHSPSPPGCPFHVSPHFRVREAQLLHLSACCPSPTCA